MLSRPDYLGRPGIGLQTAPLSADARATHSRVVETLNDMLRCGARTPLAPSFITRHRRLLHLISTFQQQVLACEQRTPSCGPGCAACCMHWVEDVNSFEAEVLADNIRREHPDLIAGIVERCRADAAAIEELDQHVMHAMGRSEAERKAAGVAFDHADLLLASFYRLHRPCPLLAADKRCLAYELRPITCRIYVSFSPPAHCDADYADEHDIPTVLLDLEENANELLDSLHARYDRFDNDTSLRTLLMRLLE